MDLKTTIAIFGTVFLAELGDKTQLATVLFASNRQNTPLAVFVAAAAALVASAIAPLAGGDPSLYLSMTMMLTLLVGLMCVAASFLRLGAIADFLSKPILVGFMNGLSLSIVLSQMGPLFGIPLDSAGFFPRVVEFLTSLSRTQLPTMGVGLLALSALLAAQRYLPRIPAALVAMTAAALVAQLLGLDRVGVQMIGEVPGGLPQLTVPSVPLNVLPVLLAEAAGLALVSFSSMMLVARSFADKNRYDVDPDREIAALGAANLAAAVSQSFVVTGSGPRTGINCRRSEWTARPAGAWAPSGRSSAFARAAGSSRSRPRFPTSRRAGASSTRSSCATSRSASGPRTSCNAPWGN